MISTVGGGAGRGIATWVSRVTHLTSGGTSSTTMNNRRPWVVETSATCACSDAAVASTALIPPGVVARYASANGIDITCASSAAKAAQLTHTTVIAAST